MSANPGSHEAKKLGCTCPVIDNAFGKGAVVNGTTDPRNFYIDPDCPVHQDMRGLSVDSGGTGHSDRTVTEAVESEGDSPLPDDEKRQTDDDGPQGYGHGPGITESKGDSPT